MANNKVKLIMELQHVRGFSLIGLASLLGETNTEEAKEIFYYCKKGRFNYPKTQYC